jgi:hypothetical protein
MAERLQFGFEQKGGFFGHQSKISSIINSDSYSIKESLFFL